MEPHKQDSIKFQHNVPSLPELRAEDQKPDGFGNRAFPYFHGLCYSLKTFHEMTYVKLICNSSRT